MNVMMVNETSIKTESLLPKADANASDRFSSELDRATVNAADSAPKNQGTEKTQNPKNDETEEAAAENTETDAECKGIEDVVEKPAQEDNEPIDAQAAAAVMPILIPMVDAAQAEQMAAESESGQTTVAAATDVTATVQNESLASSVLIPVLTAEKEADASTLTGAAPQVAKETGEAAASTANAVLEGTQATDETKNADMLAVKLADGTTAETQTNKAVDFAEKALREIKNLLKTVGEPVATQNGAELAADKTLAASSEPAATFEGETKQNDAKQNESKQQTSGVMNTQTPATAYVTAEGKVDLASSVTQAQELPQVKNAVFSTIVDKVTTAVGSEKSEMYVQLKPEHLGGLTISLVMEESGLTAKLVTSEQSVQHMIHGQMVALQEALKDKGINVVHMEVIYDQMSNMTDNNQTKNGDNGTAPSYYAGENGSLEGLEEVANYVYGLSSYDVLTEQGGSVEFSA